MDTIASLMWSKTQVRVFMAIFVTNLSEYWACTSGESQGKYFTSQEESPRKRYFPFFVVNILPVAHCHF
ncbi:unnamed protein product [Ceratitis capitata]|uniref:(Mediterranean fruit fly) hypothetical protein n=1 Tax=Ceratitis capitata TaxID=7213 RepID=A0A811UTS8_CERCA|nr:unnamed protein product [Ceratitis capitata]